MENDTVFVLDKARLLVWTCLIKIIYQRGIQKQRKEHLIGGITRCSRFFAEFQGTRGGIPVPEYVARSEVGGDVILR